MARLLFAAIASAALATAVTATKNQQRVSMEYDPACKCIRAAIGDTEATADKVACDFEKGTITFEGTKEHPATLVNHDEQKVYGSRITMNVRSATIKIEGVQSLNVNPKAL